jgi:hypothetical protein
MSADPATEDHGELVGLPDCSFGVQQSFAEVVQRRTAMKDSQNSICEKNRRCGSRLPLAPSQRGTMSAVAAILGRKSISPEDRVNQQAAGGAQA